MTDLAYKATNPAKVYISNDPNVILGLEAGSIMSYDDPLDLENTMVEFEYHLGDKQTQKMFLTLVNPNQQIENKLFATYAALIPRAFSPTTLYTAPGGLSSLAGAMRDRTFFCRWGYTVPPDPLGGGSRPGAQALPAYALSHIHKVELINLHYSFSENKERIFKLEFVDAYTRAITSASWIKPARSFKVPINTMDNWRLPSRVIQEILLQMLVNVEGYVGYSKFSAIQNQVIDSDFKSMLKEIVFGYKIDPSNPNQGPIATQQFEEQLGVMIEDNGWLVAPPSHHPGMSTVQRFAMYPNVTGFSRNDGKLMPKMATWTSGVGLTPSSTQQMYSQADVDAAMKVATQVVMDGLAEKAVMAVRNFYYSFGADVMSFDMAPQGDGYISAITHTYNPDPQEGPRSGQPDIRWEPTLKHPGQPAQLFSCPAEFPIGNHLTGPLATTVGGPYGPNPWQQATIEASVAAAKELTAFVAIPDAGNLGSTGNPYYRWDMKAPQYESSPGAGDWQNVTIHERARALGTPAGTGLAYYGRPSPYGDGYTYGLSISDMEQILDQNYFTPVYPIGGLHGPITTPNAESHKYNVGWAVWYGPDEPGNSVEYALLDVDRVQLSAQIQALGARTDDYIAEQQFDPTVSSTAAEVVANSALSRYNGVLALQTEPKDLSSVLCGDCFEDPPPGTPSEDIDRSDPYDTPLSYRHNLKVNVPTDRILSDIQKMLSRLNKIYFKSADQYLQFCKIEMTEISDSDRDDFEILLGVNISDETWEDKEGFILLTTQAFVKKIYKLISPGAIRSFTGIDLTDTEFAVEKTIGLSLGYDSRSDGIVTNFQWRYPVPHLMYGIREIPTAVTKAINIGKRWSTQPRFPAGASPSPSLEPGYRTSPHAPGTPYAGLVSQTIALAFVQNAEHNKAFLANTQGLTTALTTPDALKVRQANKGVWTITGIDVTTVSAGTEDFRLITGDVVFTEAALLAALAQVQKMDRSDLDALVIPDVTHSSGASIRLTDAQKDIIKDALIEDLQFISSKDMMEAFFPALDPEQNEMVATEYWIDGQKLKLEVPTFRKIASTPLGHFAGGDPDNIDGAAAAVIAGKMEWLNKFAKTIISAHASTLGIPEMDLLGSEIFVRNIFLDVHEPRAPGERHWLTGVYNPRDIVHKIDSKGGYTMDMGLVRSGKDTSRFIETLTLIRRGRA